jgi:phage-related protein
MPSGMARIFNAAVRLLGQVRNRVLHFRWVYQYVIKVNCCFIQYLLKDNCGVLLFILLEWHSKKYFSVNIKFCIIPMPHFKFIKFRSTSLNDLKTFPREARREGGHQLDQVQRGLEPDDWMPMLTIGTGVREIRMRDISKVFRIIYVVKFTDAVYVLHCFQKQSQKTSQRDLDLAESRYRELVEELKNE